MKKLLLLPLLAMPAFADHHDHQEKALVNILELAIERGVPLFNDGQPGACAAVYEVAARAVVRLELDELSEEEQMDLVRALDRFDASENPREKAWILRKAFDRILERRARDDFEPIMEAPLPKGFPGPGPVGEVVHKTYPRYRAARTDGMNAFGKLFRHISKNEIAMTAPVEMTMHEYESGGLARKDMAFLYVRPDLGETGHDGEVQVLDLPSMEVLSHGIRGPLTIEKTKAAKASIERELRARGLVAAGKWRMMGYNSPMVRRENAFWELQLPVRAADGE